MVTRQLRVLNYQWNKAIIGKLPLSFHKSCMYPYSTQHMYQQTQKKLPLSFHKSCMYPYSTQHMYQQTQKIKMGSGQVFVEYADLQGAVKAKSSLHGQKLGSNTIQ